MGESHSSNSLKASETIVVRTLLTKKAEDIGLKVFIEIKQQTWDVLRNFYLNGSCKPSMYLPRSPMKSALCFIRLSYLLLSLRLRTIVPVVWDSSIFGEQAAWWSSLLRAVILLLAHCWQLISSTYHPPCVWVVLNSCVIHCYDSWE